MLVSYDDYAMFALSGDEILVAISGGQMQAFTQSNASCPPTDGSCPPLLDQVCAPNVVCLKDRACPPSVPPPMPNTPCPGYGDVACWSNGVCAS